jgi:hypothetical protein
MPSIPSRWEKREQGREEEQLVADWTFGSFLWASLVFFFWVMMIWMFIAIFADILRRRDLSGWGKAAWCILVFALPFIGILVYLIARPRMQMSAPGDVWDGQVGYSSADEIEKLVQLRQSGAITPEEFDRMKQHAIA